MVCSMLNFFQAVRVMSALYALIVWYEVPDIVSKCDLLQYIARVVYTFYLVPGTVDLC